MASMGEGQTARQARLRRAVRECEMSDSQQKYSLTRHSTRRSVASPRLGVSLSTYNKFLRCLSLSAPCVAQVLRYRDSFQSYLRMGNAGISCKIEAQEGNGAVDSGQLGLSPRSAFTGARGHRASAPP